MPMPLKNRCGEWQEHETVSQWKSFSFSVLATSCNFQALRRNHLQPTIPHLSQRSATSQPYAFARKTPSEMQWKSAMAKSQQQNDKRVTNSQARHMYCYTTKHVVSQLPGCLTGKMPCITANDDGFVGEDCPADPTSAGPFKPKSVCLKISEGPMWAIFIWPWLKIRVPRGTQEVWH